MRQFIFLSTIILVFSSCSNHPEASMGVFKATAEGLEKANKNISTNNLFLYNEFENKASDPLSAEKAKLWEPKVKLIKSLCSELTKYIQGLKNELKTEADLRIENGKEVFREDNLDAVGRLFILKDKGHELGDKLFRFKKEILNVDPELNQVFKERIIITTESFESTNNSQNNFSKTFFKHLPVIAALGMLSKFENNILITENEFVNFCNNQIGYLDGESMYEKYTFVVAQKSSYLMAGEVLEIYAGIGAFSDKSKPVVTIYGKNVPFDENAIAIYKFITPFKAGRYSVPVKIEYTKPDGTKDFMTKNIEYTVIEPNQNPQ